MANVQRIEPLAAPPDAEIVLPGSKSITNRALITAALAEGSTELQGVLLAEDTWAMIEALRLLGIAVAVDDHECRVVIDGCGGELPGVEVTVDAHQSGTTGRFLAPFVALGKAPVVVDGDDQLKARPMNDLIDALRDMGVSVTEMGEPGRLPLRMIGPPSSRGVALPGDVSSQFVSGLLLAGAVSGIDLRLTTAPVSRPYLDMTTAVMSAFDANVRGDGDSSWTTEGGYRSPATYVIEPDASAASYFMAAAVICGGHVRIPGLGRESIQGDVAFAEVLARMGADVELGDQYIDVRANELHGVDVDLRHISDTAPTLAVVAAFADGPTRVSGIGFIRDKESDRIAGPVVELNRCGVLAEETGDGFVIRPTGMPRPAAFETYGDHRMAMAFALIGLVVDGVVINDPDCVAKTFPDFFSALDQLR